VAAWVSSNARREDDLSPGDDEHTGNSGLSNKKSIQDQSFHTQNLKLHERDASLCEKCTWPWPVVLIRAATSGRPLTAVKEW